MELVKAGPVGPDTARFQLHDLASPCELWCRFCPRSFDLRRPEPGSVALQAKVRAAFAAFLARHAHGDVVVLSADILAWPDLFGLLDLARDAGRRITLLTPGVRLDDAAFVDRLAGYPVRFDLTWLSPEADTHARITGVPGAHARLVAGIANLRARGLSFRLSTVLNEDNVDELPEIVRSAVAMGARHLTVRLFWPDYDRARPAYFAQFPSFAALEAALGRLAADPPDPMPTIELTNTPPCQLDLAVAGDLPVLVRPGLAVHNTFRTEGFAACAACPVSATCVRVHPAYAARHPVREPDLDLVARNLARSEATLEAARSAGAGRTVQTEGWIVPTEAGA